MLPDVTAIMLVDGRHDMTARAVQSFMAQTYPEDKRYLLIWDTGDPHYAPPFVYDPHGIEIWHRQRGPSIGALRNAANKEARGEIIIHFDSDDLSHPNRIAEQVALLKSSGAECVGYNEMLFWDTATEHTFSDERGVGTAWLYTGPSDQYCLGTSMCYWRETWERNPFADTNAGCDDLYWHGRGLRMVAHPAWGPIPMPVSPRIIAAIHGGNTCAAIDPTSTDWRRMPEWDSTCRRLMCA